MARIRYIKPEFPEDVKLARLPREVRLLYCCLWCWMDRQGVTEDEPQIIKKNVFPYDDDVSVARIILMLDLLCAAGRLYRTEFKGIKLLYCPGFAKHQKFHPGEKPKYSIPVKHLQDTCEQAASQLPLSFNEPASSTLTLTLTGTGTGIGTGTGMGTGEGDAAEGQRKLEEARVRAGLDRSGKDPSSWCKP